jgi:CBS domain-containing protein
MYVHELMTPAPAVCTTSDSLSRAAQIMWDRDCGVVPVLDAAGHLAGIVTDRDLCMAAYTQGVALHQLNVESVMSKVLTTIGAEDRLEDALETLAEAEVRRLPVVDEEGRLVGILSLADVVRAAQRTSARRSPKAEALVVVLASVTRPRPVSAVAAVPMKAPRELASKVIVPAARKTKSRSRASKAPASKSTASKSAAKTRK